MTEMISMKGFNGNDIIVPTDALVKSLDFKLATTLVRAKFMEDIKKSPLELRTVTVVHRDVGDFEFYLELGATLGIPVYVENETIKRFSQTKFPNTDIRSLECGPGDFKTFIQGKFLVVDVPRQMLNERTDENSLILGGTFYDPIVD